MLNDPPDTPQGDRAVAFEIGKAIATIVGISIIWGTIAKPAWDKLNAEADTQVTNATAQQGVDWLALGFDNFLIVILAITVLGVIAFAAFQRQGGL